jgi:S-ribosylhomocysteine lyase LuxS involved in autoinducer biosynthesis
MLLLDSFKVDHKIMNAPAVGLAKEMQTLESFQSLYNLRFPKDIIVATYENRK